MDAEKYLEQIKAYDTVIKNKLKDYRRWVELATSLGGFSDGERVKSSPNLQRGADNIGNYIDIEREIAELRRQRETIIKTLEQLPRIEYKLLYKLYVEYNAKGEDYSLKEIAYDFKKPYDCVRKRRKKALRLLQNVLDKKGG